MAIQLFENNAVSSLNGSISNGGTTATLFTGEGSKFPTPTGGDYFLLTLFEHDGSNNEVNFEVVQVTARTADTLTVVRDYEGTVAANGGPASGGYAFPTVGGRTVYAQLRFTKSAANNFLQLGHKDASGGYAGLTAFKINFKNALDTFISFFTNANTAARTYTFQDRDGTIADDTDLALKAPKASPSFTGDVTLNTLGGKVLAKWDGLTSYIQTNVANASTWFPLLPNGTGSSAAIHLRNSGTDLTNYASLEVQSGASAMCVMSTQHGSASYLPIWFYTNNAPTLKLDADNTATFISDVNTGGNLNLTGSAKRILGTWNSSLTGSAIQSSATDASTYVSIIPNGIARTAGVMIYNYSSGTTGAYCSLDGNSAQFALNCGNGSTGAYIPFVVNVAGADRLKFNTDGTILFNGAGNMPGYKNLIINGSCRVAQRDNVAVVPGTYTYGGADRIKVGTFAFSAFSGTIARYSSSLWVSGNAQHAFVSSSTGVGNIEFTTALEAAATYHLRSRTVTMSCRVYQDSGSNQSFRMGIYKANAVDNFSGVTLIGSIQATQTIVSEVATDISYTVTLGASDANNGLLVLGQFFGVGALSAKSFMIGDFQLVEGSVATPFEMPPIALELAQCQRFAKPIPRATGQAYSTTQVLTYHDVSGMRATPTLSTTTGWLALLPGGGGSSATISISDAINNDVKTLTTTSGMTAGHSIGLLPPSGALFLAEL